MGNRTKKKKKKAKRSVSGKGLILISHSGRRSRETAELLHHYLPGIFRGRVRVELTDQQAGSRRRSDFRRFKRLRAVVFCVTPENCEESFFQYDAGWLAGATGAPLLNYLYRLNPGDLPGALSWSYSVPADRSGSIRLSRWLERTTGESPRRRRKLDRATLRLAEDLRRIQPLTLAEALPDFQQNVNLSLLQMPLREQISQQWRNELEELQWTIRLLRSRQSRLQYRLSPYIAEALGDYVAGLTRYATAASQLLLQEKNFSVGANGLLEIDPATHLALDSLREEVAVQTTELLTPQPPPVLQEAPRYARLSSSDRRLEFILGVAHRKLWRNKKERRKMLKRCAASPWDLDRIIFFWRAGRKTVSLKRLTRLLLLELDRASSLRTNRFDLPLTFAARAVLKRVQHHAPAGFSPLLASRLRRYLEIPGRDPDGQLRLLAVHLERLSTPPASSSGDD